MMTYAQLIEHYEALAVRHAHDRVERMRYAGYAIMLRDLLMAPRQRVSDVNLRKLYGLEGLLVPRRLVVDTQPQDAVDSSG